MADFTHFDADGKAVMVDIAEKAVTHRKAIAEGVITLTHEMFDAAITGKSAKKGDVLGVARIAGIMAAKQCASIIPLCHSLSLTKASVDFNTGFVTEKDSSNPDSCRIRAICTAETDGKTGVEMEALTGVSAALLTIYDMCKAFGHGMVISDIRLCHKSGGKSGECQAENKMVGYD